MVVCDPATIQALTRAVRAAHDYLAATNTLAFRPDSAVIGEAARRAHAELGAALAPFRQP